MRAIGLEFAVNATGGKLVNPADGVFITGVERDSRNVQPGDLFLAIKGERVDGHTFINSVFEKGAAAVLCEYVPEGVSGPCIVVENVIKALQDLAEAYRRTLKATIIGITGSVGKTSTKEVISGVLSASFKVQKTLGNLNNEIGLPLTVLSINDETEIAVLEMGISNFGEMRVLSKVARPDICVITNIGEAHLEFLKSRDGILSAKSEIFEYMNPEGRVYLNGDDDKLITVVDVNGIKPVFYGFSDSNDAYPTNVEPLGLGGSNMKIHYKHMSIDGHINIPGHHMVANAVVAASIAHDLNMSDTDITIGLNQASTIKGRCNIIPYKKSGYIIDDCYNASPASMISAIDTLNLAEGRKVAILGDMFELGADSDKMHASVGEYAVKAGIDKLICVGANCLHMYKSAMSTPGRTGIVHYKSLDELIKNISMEVKPQDNILVKSSNGMGFSKLIDALLTRE